MSRRDSRVHISVRQNDTLQEFQNFKKSFLVANKQITKQNSSLSAKIEELNAHISTLYVENLRLRASEIALASQLKREKEKCQRIMADAEAATMNLLKHLGIIKQSYSISPPTSGKSTPDPKDSDSPPTQVTSLRPRPRSPTAPRILSQQPSVPDIVEDPEPHDLHFEERDHKHHHDVPSDATHVSTTINISRGRQTQTVSRLPVPSRVVSPPPPHSPALASLGLNLSGDTLHAAKHKQLTRRSSGLMSPPDNMPERPFSPTFGSHNHIRLELSDDEIVEVEVLSMGAGHADEMIKCQNVSHNNNNKIDEHQEVPKEKVKKERKSRPPKDVDGEQDGVTERKVKKKTKERVSGADVTNSSRPRETSSLAENSENSDPCREKRDTGNVVHSDLPPSSSPTSFSDPGYLPTPLPSSAASTPVPSLPLSDIDPNAGGRERRSRKSVNYTEPSLRKKMRKPDVIAPPPGARPSLSVIPTPDPSPPPEHLPRHSLDSSDTDSGVNALPSDKPRSSGSSRMSSSSVTKRKRPTKANSDDGSETADCDEEDDGADADGESGDLRSMRVNGMTRRRSTQETGERAAAANDKRRTREGEDLRRHSIAV